MPTSAGKMKDLSKFDAEFFGINERDAHYMDAQIRNMLELTYEAIWDSGNLIKFLTKFLKSIAI